MSLWKDRKTKTWKYTFQINGKVYGGGGHKTKGEARDAREEKRRNVLSGKVSHSLPSTSKGSEKTPMTFLEMAGAYLQSSERRHASKTFKYKQFVYRTFLKQTGGDGLLVSEVTPYLIQTYLQTRPSNSNYNRHRKDLGALFEYARRVLGVIQINPCNVIDKLPEEKAPKKIPTQEEFVKMITQAGEEERPLMVVLAYTAARIDEALRLKWKDVNFEHGFIRLWTRKTKDGAYRGREIPMRGFMKSFMMSLWEKRVQDHWVFFNPHTQSRYNRRPKLMKGLCKRLEIPQYGFHSLRHFVSSYLLDREKIGKPTVGRMLGHQSLSTTDIYAHSINVNSADDALDMAMDKLEAAFVPKLKPASSSCGSVAVLKVKERKREEQVEMQPAKLLTFDDNFLCNSGLGRRGSPVQIWPPRPKTKAFYHRGHRELREFVE